MNFYRKVLSEKENNNNSNNSTKFYVKKVYTKYGKTCVFSCEESSNHTHVKKLGHTSEFFLAFIDELEKQIIIKKNC